MGFHSNLKSSDMARARVGTVLGTMEVYVYIHLLIIVILRNTKLKLAKKPRNYLG